MAQSQTLVLPPKKKRSTKKVVRNWIIAVLLIAMYVWTFSDIGINWSQIFSERTLNNMGRVIPQLFSPEWAVAPDALRLMGETLAMAYTGTLMAALLAVPFGFFAAKNMIDSRLINTAAKWSLDGIRAFPEIMLALIFVAAIGPSAFAGVLAIAVGSIGMLGKLYSEVIESIDMHVVESLEANGANKAQILFYGIIPQVIPEFLSYAIYRYEIDVRSSTILGLIGAGGIGMMIQISTMNRNWDEVGMALLIIILVVTVIDYFSSYLRKRIV
ncbi:MULTISPECIES: phosphonate ABC transporter, permease protein PhnE [Alteribacter]|uniref:Phosphonate ABC transporter, permease protein PhnE n=1 Tax=Alteribacter keqinensis TaxID=2483800 RepID=A0A3M7TTE6_9BACI|nr:MULTISPECIES: phosphonate ABC transporter, permease protein PhnE [Alteribacter]MBM7097522.1 phosphonate ABC transporter, permease protein PhnE [Alteribacter salitolerans]RNA68481.1 phosphonate ABC transporter, permease protein PhnE [Alteribacter keqinensis]